MTKHYTEYDDSTNFTYSFTVDEPLVTAVILDLQTFIVAKAHAKCDETDTFNLEFGKSLASSRAAQRLERKYQKALIRSLG